MLSEDHFRQARPAPENEKWTGRAIERERERSEGEEGGENRDDAVDYK
jgi:hypothetical protein